MKTTRRRDDGYTLVELLVAMGVASVLLIAIGVVFLGITRGVTTIDVKTATTADGRITMEAMTRSMRVAFKPTNQDAAIVSATGTGLTFYALLNRTGSPVATAPNPTLVSYSFDGTCVNQTLTPATADASGNLTWNSGAATTCLARTTTAPAFSYYLSAATSSTMSVGAGLSLNDRKLVRSIGVNLSVQDAANPSVKAVPLTDRVTLTNLVADDNNPDT